MGYCYSCPTFITPPPPVATHEPPSILVNHRHSGFAAAGTWKVCQGLRDSGVGFRLDTAPTQ